MSKMQSKREMNDLEKKSMNIECDDDVLSVVIRLDKDNIITTKVAYDVSFFSEMKKDPIVRSAFMLELFRTINNNIDESE